MDNVLKRRLIGASILIALAVIFLPMLLVGPEPELDDRRLSEALPEMPAADREVRRIPLDPGLARVPPSRVDDSSDGIDAGVDAGPDDRGAAAGGESAVAPAVTRRDVPDEIVLNPGDAGGSRDGPRESSAAAEPPAQRRTEPDPSGPDVSTTVDEAATGAGETDASASAQPASAQQASSSNGQSSSNEQTAARPPAAETPPQAGDGNWVVQVASFGSQESSQATRDRLEALGHPVIADEVVRGDTMLYRLRTGPYADRSRADTARGQIAATVAGVEPIVREVSDAALQATPGFAVQVGSFASEENAERETARLRNLGFDAFRQGEDASGRAIWKVLVGTLDDRAEAETLRARLVGEAGVEGLIVSHP